MSPDTIVYLNSIWARANDAILVGHKEVQFRDGSIPAARCCHGNVDRWVTENPYDTIVRGWCNVGGDKYSGWLTTHSVVRSGQELFDITPIDGRSALFIEHLGTVEEFEPFLAPRFNGFAWPQGAT